MESKSGISKLKKTHFLPNKITKLKFQRKLLLKIQKPKRKQNQRNTIKSLQFNGMPQEPDYSLDSATELLEFMTQQLKTSPIDKKIFKK
jgi:hypothetical protein